MEDLLCRCQCVHPSLLMGPHVAPRISPIRKSNTFPCTLAAQLGLHAFTAKDTGLIPAQGTKILQALHQDQKLKKQNQGREDNWIRGAFANTWNQSTPGRWNPKAEFSSLEHAEWVRRTARRPVSQGSRIQAGERQE